MTVAGRRSRSSRPTAFYCRHARQDDISLSRKKASRASTSTAPPFHITKYEPRAPHHRVHEHFMPSFRRRPPAARQSDAESKPRSGDARLPALIGFSEVADTSSNSCLLALRHTQADDIDTCGLSGMPKYALRGAGQGARAESPPADIFATPPATGSGERAVSQLRLRAERCALGSCSRQPPLRAQPCPRATPQGRRRPMARYAALAQVLLTTP